MKKLVFLVIIFLLVSMTFFVGCDSEEITLPTETKTVEPTSTLTPTPEPTPTLTPTPEPTATPTPEPAMALVAMIESEETEISGTILSFDLIVGEEDINLETIVFGVDYEDIPRDKITGGGGDRKFELFVDGKLFGRCYWGPDFPFMLMSFPFGYLPGGSLKVEKNSTVNIKMKGDLRNWSPNGEISIEIFLEGINVEIKGNVETVEEPLTIDGLPLSYTKIVTS